MSHELRSPLNAILGFSQLMMRSQTLPSEHVENAGIITRSGEHLLTLINQVLDLSKIEAGRTTLNENDFDLYRLLCDIEDMFKLKADDKGLQLVCDRPWRCAELRSASLTRNRASDVPRYIRTDEVKLRQILINLLNNALKFTSEGGVTVRVSTTRILNADARMKAWESRNNQSVYPLMNTEESQDNQSVHPFMNADASHNNQSVHPCNHPCRALLCFEVEDTGAGIAPEEIDSIFEAFVQSQTGKQAQEGTGLGLPITRKFVQMMGGEMTVSSVVGRGTTFKFDITVGVVDATDVETKKPTRRVIALEPNQQSYRILIVDDRYDNRQLLIKLLNPLGFEIREASNGKEAIALWDCWEPHLIWMDMRMPVMDGYEATKQIRATTKGQATAIIALTASAFEEERAIVLSAGCDDFLRKPFREADIFEMMHKHIGVRYIYDEPTDSTQAKTDIQNVLTKEALVAVPIELLVNLSQATRLCDLEEINSYINEIRNYNTALADTLATLANEFQYPEIVSLIQQMGNG
jgi:signal transduction histidine kinase/CheY-like chemotaxis protein